MIRSLYERLADFLGLLRHPFLLFCRLYWGWQFFEAGKGKLGNIAPVADFFQGLGIPWPMLNAYVVGVTECLGGLLLMLGLASRLTAIPLTITMTVAYLTADPGAVKSFFSDPDVFVKAAPFPFLLTSLLVMVFGPGLFSLDALIKRFLERARSA